MKKARCILFDFNPTKSVVRPLREILEAGVEILQECAVAHDQNFCTRTFIEMIARFNPNVMLIVFPLNQVKQVRALVRPLRQEFRDSPIIVASEVDEPREMVALLELGVSDFITPPFKAIDVLPRVWRLSSRTYAGDALTQSLAERFGLNRLVGGSKAFVTEVRKIPLVAKCNASILISGETGTGKELCARAIHYLSPRASKPFIPVNCGAIPVELVENELFGHQRGAFTGASTSQPGLIRVSDHGTLFLDEIDCLPPLAQTKVLRFLQEKEYRPLGSVSVYHADVRVIAATNANLEKVVGEGKLREDLYYRLNIIPIVLPPLRKRREDILLLAHHFLTKYTSEFDKEATAFSSDAAQALILYDWPGNIRELENVIERATLLSQGTLIRSVDLLLPHRETSVRRGCFQKEKAKVIAEFERGYIDGLLSVCQGNITKAAQAAQKNRRAFWQLIRKHRIDPQSYRAAASENVDI